MIPKRFIAISLLIVGFSSSQVQAKKIILRLPHYNKLTQSRTNRKPYLERTKNVSLLEIRAGSTVPHGDTLPNIFRLLNAIDYFGTGVFAFSGALTAAKKGMDLFGIITLSVISAVGGGTVRDLLLDSGTVFWMKKPIYFEICVSVAILTFFIWPMLESRLSWNASAKAICIADALGLGAFAVLGTQTAADHPGNLDPILWVVSGAMSSTFGGLTRDVICFEQPRVMYPHRTMYAAPPLMGSALYATLTAYLSMPEERAAFIAFTFTFLFRLRCFDNPVRLPYWRTNDNVAKKI